MAFAALAAFAFTTGDRANAQSVVCSGGHWVVNGVGSYNPGANSGIPCDESKPGWIFDWNNPGRIKWVYDGDRVVTPYTTEGSSVVRTTVREVQEQGNKRPPVNQPRATDASAYLYQADRNNRAVRGADGQCYREQRISGQWRRSGAYGATAEACRRAAWNAHFRAQGQPTVNPAGGTFPDGPAPKPLLQAGTMGATGATVDGLTLTLTFNQALDGNSLPAPGAFRVTVNGARRSVASGGVAISGMTVTLTLTSAVRGGDTVRVGYTKPSASPLRGASGFPVETFTNQAVTNNTPIWSATLTVAQSSTGTYRGCFPSTAVTTACSNSLTSSSFVSGGTTYTVVTVSLTTSSAEVTLTLDRAISQDWTLHIGNQEFSVADATLSSSDRTATWANAGFTWTANQKVQLRLTR
ncbi:MAG: SwmB domain-containing protein [Chloroflexota bacterium]|nr:SwmB domain-containing protein [Chloroflexota bacterium]